MRRTWAVASILLALFADLPCAFADPVEDFYKGRQVRFLIGYPAGTDDDNWGRLIARHWSAFLPGHPNFIVQNMPGAGEILATNYLYNVAEKDGATLLMTDRSLPYLELLGDPNTRFESTKFNWIGSPEQTNRICAAIQGAPVQKASDLFTRELVVGGSRAGSAASKTPILLSKLLGMKFKMIEGYTSADHIMLAMEHGELQGICQTLAGLRSLRPGWVESGRLNILFNMERDPIPGLEAPTIFDFTKTDEEREIIALYDANLEFGRPIVAPPGVPPERVAALRHSFATMMDDAAFKDDAENQGYGLTPRKGEILQGFVDQLMATPKDVVDKVKALTK
jgi:tripartite-type tricarboxylate transporter receptor subunit TctC